MNLIAKTYGSSGSGSRSSFVSKKVMFAAEEQPAEKRNKVLFVKYLSCKEGPK